MLTHDSAEAWDVELLARLDPSERARAVRQWLDEKLGAQDLQNACAVLCDVDVPARDRAFMASLVRKYGSQLMNGRRMRVAVAGTSTLNELADLLRFRLLAEGFVPEVHLGGFNQMHLELRKPEGFWPWTGAPDAVLVGLDFEGLMSRVVEVDPVSDVVMDEVSRALSDLEDTFSAFRKSHEVPIIVNNLPLVTAGLQGFAEGSAPHSARALINHFNNRLAELAHRHRDVFVVDLCAVAADLGGRRFFDARRWFYGRIPCSSDGFVVWAREAASLLAALARGSRKCIVVDLDNTLWGGVLGDLGPLGVELGAEGIGLAYRDFQRELLRIKRLGVLLAIVSKNDERLVHEVFERNGHLLLSQDDFVTLRINWNPKPENLRSISSELNLSLDSFLFLDDSPHERSMVRRELPEVLTPVLPEDPVDRPNFLRRLTGWYPVRVTAEDRNRSEYYQQEKQRAALAERSTDVEGFLTSLGLILTFKRVGEEDMPRVAQMHRRTNQFNLTTRRLTLAQLAQRRVEPDYGLYMGAVEDRFGDQGHVIVAVVKIHTSIPNNHISDGPVWELESFLMSCRVVGRRVETAFLREIAREAARAGARYVMARFIPTERNRIASRVLPEHGFVQVDDDRDNSDGGSTWKLALESVNQWSADPVRVRYPGA